MSKWVKWTQRDMGSISNVITGEMPMNKIEETLVEFRKSAEEYLKKSGAEHVIYATKEYSQTGELIHIKFYTRLVKTDYELSSLLKLTNREIYAVHRRD